MNHHDLLGLATPATYQIRLKRMLDENWSDYLEGMMIRLDETSDERPVTTLTILVD